eukprot:gene7786-15927_t
MNNLNNKESGSETEGPDSPVSPAVGNWDDIGFSQNEAGYKTQTNDSFEIAQSQDVSYYSQLNNFSQLEGSVLLNTSSPLRKIVGATRIGPKPLIAPTNSTKRSKPAISSITVDDIRAILMKLPKKITPWTVMDTLDFNDLKILCKFKNIPIGLKATKSLLCEKVYSLMKDGMFKNILVKKKNIPSVDPQIQESQQYMFSSQFPEQQSQSQFYSQQSFLNQNYKEPSTTTTNNKNNMTTASKQKFQTTNNMIHHHQQQQQLGQDQLQQGQNYHNHHPELSSISSPVQFQFTRRQDSNNSINNSIYNNKNNNNNNINTSRNILSQHRHIPTSNNNNNNNNNNTSDNIPRTGILMASQSSNIPILSSASSSSSNIHNITANITANNESNHDKHSWRPCDDDTAALLNKHNSSQNNKDYTNQGDDIDSSTSTRQLKALLKTFQNTGIFIPFVGPHNNNNSNSNSFKNAAAIKTSTTTSTTSVLGKRERQGQPLSQPQPPLLQDTELDNDNDTHSNSNLHIHPKSSHTKNKLSSLDLPIPSSLLIHHHINRMCDMRMGKDADTQTQTQSQHLIDTQTHHSLSVSKPTTGQHGYNSNNNNYNNNDVYTASDVDAAETQAVAVTTLGSTGRLFLTNQQHQQHVVTDTTPVKLRNNTGLGTGMGSEIGTGSGTGLYTTSIRRQEMNNRNRNGRNDTTTTTATGVDIGVSNTIGMKVSKTINALKVVQFDELKLGLVLSKTNDVNGGNDIAIIRSKDIKVISPTVSHLLCVGDQLVMVDGVSVTGLSFNEQVNLLMNSQRPIIVGFIPGLTGKFG